MIVFPHAKINLGLHITGKLGADNRDYADHHRIETVLYPVGMHDALEVIESHHHANRIFLTGHPLPKDNKPNLCLQAIEVLSDYLSEQLPPLDIHLHKGIPVGAGLGGGSSDATHMLLLLNRMFQLNLSEEVLYGLSARLGSDCPFFLFKKPMLATGRGDILRDVCIQAMENKHLLIIVPPIHISTAIAYQHIQPAQPASSIPDILSGNISKWKYQLINQFEELVCTWHPAIKDIIEELMKMGAIYAALSGSGSAVFGIFAHPPDVHKMKQAFPTALVKTVETGVFEKSLNL